MTKTGEKSTPAQAAAAARAARLAAELRANLRKRKEKARAGRSSVKEDDSPAPGDERTD